MRILIISAQNDLFFKSIFNSIQHNYPECIIDILTWKSNYHSFEFLNKVDTIYLIKEEKDAREIQKKYNILYLLYNLFCKQNKNFQHADILYNINFDSCVLMDKYMKLHLIKHKNLSDIERIKIINVEKKNEVKSHYPQVLRVEPTNRCSSQCIMCPNKSIVREQGIHDLQPDAIPDQILKNVSDVIFLQNGEFTESSFLYEWLNKLNCFNNRLHVTTNGMFLSSSIYEKLIDANLTSITFSIDSLDNDTFSSIRKGCDLNRVLESMKQVLSLKRKGFGIFPIVQVNVTLMKSNIAQLDEILIGLNQYGVDIIKLDYVKIHRNNVELNYINPNESLFYHQLLANQIIDKSYNIAKNFLCEIRFPPKFNNSNKNGQALSKPILPVTKYCQQPFTDIVVWSNGDVTPCNGAQNIVIGNAYEKKLLEIWNSNEAQIFRAMMSSQNPPSECINCVCSEDYSNEIVKEDWHVY